VTDTLAWWALTLRQHGFTDAQIAEVFYPGRPDTFRRRDIDGKIDMLHEEEIHGRVSADAEWQYRLPYVFTDGVPATDTFACSFVNLRPTTIANLRPPAALRVEVRAYQALRGQSADSAPSAARLAEPRSA
jgi:hypothetical protein